LNFWIKSLVYFLPFDLLSSIIDLRASLSGLFKGLIRVR